MRRFSEGMLLAFLAMHLFSTNVKLLFHINPDMDMIWDGYDWVEPLFKWREIFSSEYALSSAIYALAYSVMTVYIILLMDIGSKLKGLRFMLILYFGLLDGLGVLLYYKITLRGDIWAAIYFAVYTASIVIAFGIYKVWGGKVKLAQPETMVEPLATKAEEPPEEKSNRMVRTLEENIIFLYRQNKYKQKEIAEMLGTNEPKVTRTLKKYKAGNER